MSDQHVVIVGGGFGGLVAARSLRRAKVEVTLIDRHNYHLFQPLLYQVATGGLSPANISAPLRSIFKRQKNVRVLLANARDIDLTNHQLLLDDGAIVFDTLVVATGSSHHYFGNDQWESHAPGLKTIEDATQIRSRVLMAFEQAERQLDPALAREWLRFVIVGGGPTGVELAGSLAEIARDTLRNEFRSIDPAAARIVLIDGADRVLPGYPGQLSHKAAAQLEDLGVTVRTNAMVTDVQPDRVVVRIADKAETIATRTVLWAAGVQASPLGRLLANRAHVEPDPIGRVPVGPDLTVHGHPNVFVIGDLARFDHGCNAPLPGVAPVAIQQGKYVARVISNRKQNKETPPFRYRNLGTMATIGRHRAVAFFGQWHFAGYLAWLMWLIVHLMNIVEFQNRLLVLIQWAWNYMTWNRSARLITYARNLKTVRGPPHDQRNRKEGSQPLGQASAHSDRPSPDRPTLRDDAGPELPR